MPDSLEIFRKKSIQQMGLNPDVHSGLCLTLTEDGDVELKSLNDTKKQDLVKAYIGYGGC